MIAITQGDASGIGPEILVRSFLDGNLPDECLVYGDAAALHAMAKRLKVNAPLNVSNKPARADQGLPLRDFGLLQPSDIRIGQVDRQAGAAAIAYLDAAVKDALEGRVSAIVTLPINKEASSIDHPDFEGHTEHIADLCGVPRSEVTMMLASPKLIVTHVSTHVSLREATERVKQQRVRRVIELTAEAVSQMKPGRPPRIAVAGLNPHAGEHGKFGREEIDEIIPAIESFHEQTATVTGPHSPDTVFRAALAGKHDAVVCMYHDQGHIPMKLHGFADTVNVTLGLPLLRVSVDHGTAFDIAGQGIADPQNFLQALDYAQQAISQK